MLKVCVDATAIRGQLSGIGFYNLSLLRALNELQHSQQFQGQFSLQIYYQPGLKDWCQGNWQKKNIIWPNSPIVLVCRCQLP